MSQKIKSIEAFKGLKTPVIKNLNDKFIPDFISRHFVLDFNYGLDILLSFAEILNKRHENMMKASSWYHELIKKQETLI